LPDGEAMTGVGMSYAEDTMIERIEARGIVLNKRFPLLSLMSYVWRVLGWLMTAGGLFSVVSIIFGHGDYWSDTDVVQFVMAVGVLVMGLGLVAVGEMVGVFFTIEENTRRTADQTAQLSAEVPAAPAGPQAAPSDT